MYTEKLLYFTDTRLNWPVNELPNNVEKSPFVDTVKVRLLSPFTKALETVNDKNVAIGKIRSLTSNLQYCVKRSMMRTVIDRALYKFRGFILGPHHRTIRAVESLPTQLGGLGIAIDNGYLEKLPGIFNQALRSIIRGGATGYRAQFALSGIFANDVPRGVKSTPFVREWVEHVLENLGYFPANDLSYYMRQIDPDNKLAFRVKLARLRKQGFISLNDLPREIEKSFIMRRLMEAKEVHTGYRTELIKSRVAKAWTYLEAMQQDLVAKDSPLNERELKRALMTSKKSVMIDLKETVNVILEIRDHAEAEDIIGCQDMKVKDLLHYGLPSMTVNLKHLKKV
jgi:hypothetical protein